jgi:seryl-tRNA synthetase
MAYATVPEAEARIAELEKENNGLLREVKSYKAGEKKLKDFFQGKGFDTDQDLEEQWEKLETESGKTKAEAETLTKKMEKQQKQIDNLLKSNDALANEKIESKLRTDLAKHFSDVIAGDETIENWIRGKTVKLEDGKIYRIEDEKDVPLETAIAAWKKNNPDRIKVNQSDGGGSHGTKEQPKTGPEKLEKSKFQKLTNAAKDDFLNKGGEVIAG